VSTIKRNIGLVLGFYFDSGRIYSIVLNSGISSAGRFYSDMFAAYDYGKLFFVAQMGQVQCLKRKSTWQ